MEKLEGVKPEQTIHGQPITFEAILDVGVQWRRPAGIARQGIIHRDIKPANILFTTGGPAKAADFGLGPNFPRNNLGSAKRPGGRFATAVDVPGLAVYMSPEQARGEELNGRSDLFSFALCCTNGDRQEAIYPGTNVVTTLDACCTRSGPAAKLNPILPSERRHHRQGHGEDREKRYDSAAGIKADLQRLKKETESGLVKSGGRTGPGSGGHDDLPDSSTWQK